MPRTSSAWSLWWKLRRHRSRLHSLRHCPEAILDPYGINLRSRQPVGMGLWVWNTFR